MRRQLRILLGAALMSGCTAATMEEATADDPPAAGGSAGAAGGRSGAAGAGTAGAAGAPADAAVPATPEAGGMKPPEMPPPEIMAPRVAISEVMYNPVLSNLDDNHHEFVELHNPGAMPVALGGWKLAGEIQFAFPAGATIAPGQFLVVAKNRAKLLELAKYNLSAIAAQVLGDFQGALDDGGGQVRLTDPAGAIVDAMAYDDKFPWPLAADGFGAGESWFSEDQWFARDDPRRSAAAHKYLGHSLERASYTVAGGRVGNWVPSPLDGATPGKPGSTSGTPPAIVEELAVGPEGMPAATVIRAADKVLVRARFTAGSAIANVELESQVEFDRGRKVATPMVVRTPMTPGPTGHQAVLPALPERTLVRYRITGERRPGMREVISPRPSDPVPYGRHAYFVSGAVMGKPHYEILISSENWGKMWTNISPDGRVMGCPSNYSSGCKNCVENPGWSARVPAVFVFGGEAYDVRTHYNGSPEGRTFGVDISGWPADAPRPSTGPLRALSWSVAFPRYRRFEGMNKLVLNRLNQSCPGFATFVAHFLYEDAMGSRVPASKVRRWARLFVNGVPYNYVMDVEPVAESYLERFHGKGQAIGDAFKLESDSDSGPWGVGAGMVLGPSPYCPMIPVKTRYERTYNRQSNEWRTHDELIALIEGFNAARSQGNDKLREFLTKSFDVDLTLKSYAVHQWGAPWDDWGKNYNLYKLPPQAQKPGRGAWVITPWDEDRMYGVVWCGMPGCVRASISVWCGTGPSGDAALPACNRWKKAVMDSLKTEYNAKLKELNETVLKPDNVKKLVADAVAAYDPTEARQMLAKPVCDATAEAANMRAFADKRYQSVKTQLGY